MLAPDDLKTLLIDNGVIKKTYMKDVNCNEGQ